MKRIILKSNSNGSIEPFTTLPELFEVYPALEKEYDNIVSYFSRKKKPYDVHQDFTLTRQFMNVDSVVFN